MRLDLKTWGKLSCRLVVITSEWRWDKVRKRERETERTRSQRQQQRFCTTAGCCRCTKEWASSELLTDAGELRVQTDSQKHKEEEDGPEWRDGQLGQSVWIRDERQTKPCMTTEAECREQKKSTVLFLDEWCCGTAWPSFTTCPMGIL